MRGVMRLVAVAACLVAGLGRARAADADPRPAAIVESGPEIYYLQDDAGRLVPVPGFRYRDFLELFRLREGLPAALEPPPAVLERLLVRCDLTRADTTAGTCPATIEATVRQTRPGWTRLPLGLDGFVLSAAPRHEGPGRVVIDADPGGGYLGWFDAPAGGGDVRHAVELEGTLPVELTPARDTVSVRAAPATSTTVELRTTRQRPDVVVLPPPPGRPAVAPNDDGTTSVTITGGAGPLRIRLADAGAGDAGWETVPQSTVESMVRIDGRSAFTEATIRLENLRPKTDTITVALPPRTVLRAVRPPATLVARGGTAEAPTATIAIERGADGRAGVELECDRPVDPAGGGQFEAVGFAVAEVESWRQWGRVSLVVDGDWRAEWADRPGVRRVDLPPAARRPGFVAAFAYDALPASLPVRVLPRVSRVVVEPDYRYDVGPTRIALTMRLQVAARGAPASALALDVDPTFEIEDVGPPGVVDVAAVATAAGRVTIPFLQPISGDTVVEVRGIRWIDRDTTTLSWRLPMPEADVVTPANVVVAADSDIEILPDVAATVGLVRQTAGGRPQRGGEPTLAYRMDGNRGTFVATRRFLEQRVDVAVDVRARVSEAATEVVETLRLDVAHRPLEYVDFSVPDAMDATSSLEVRQDGEPLDPFTVATDLGGTDTDSGAASRVVRVVLVEPLLGAGEVTVSYRLPTPAVPAETTVAGDLPLVLPVGPRIESQSVAIEADERLSVEVRGDGWRGDVSADDVVRTWTAIRPGAAVPLAIAARRRAAVEAVVEAAWLRTRLLPDRREDLATYVLSGGGAGLTLTVPGGADTVACSVSVDNMPLPAARDDDGGLTVTLPRGVAGRRRVVEVRSTTARPAGWAALAARIGLPARLRLAAPEFGPGVVERRFFWEVSTRPDEHLLGAPPAWTTQERWRLGPAGFARQPTVDSAALAAWIRAAGGPAPADEPPLVEGRVVYSGLGSPGRATLWLVPTWCAVLAASGTALAVGLAFASGLVARRPIVVVPLLAAVAVAAAARPDLAPLVAQAALPGLALALVGWALRFFADGTAQSAPARQRPQVVSASSLTRALPAESLVVAGSSLQSGGGVTAGGRSSS